MKRDRRRGEGGLKGCFQRSLARGFERALCGATKQLRKRVEGNELVEDTTSTPSLPLFAPECSLCRPLPKGARGRFPMLLCDSRPSSPGLKPAPQPASSSHPSFTATQATLAKCAVRTELLPPAADFSAW